MSSIVRPARHPVGAGQPHPQRQIGRPLASHRLDHLHQEARAAVQVAAIGVVAVIGDRREEGVAKVPVRAVDFRHLEPGLVRHAGGGGELRDNLGNLPGGQGMRNGRAGHSGQCAGCNRLPPTIFDRDRFAAVPRHLARCLAAGMGKLDAGDGPAFGDNCRKPRQQGLMLRRIGTQTTVGDAPDSRDVRRLGHHDARPACGLRAQMLDMPVIAEAVRCAVLTHRRHDDPIAGRDRAEADRLKEQRRGHPGRHPGSRVSGGGI